MKWTEFLSAFGIGLVTGTLGSAMWFVAIRSRAPKLEVSDNIAVGYDEVDGEPKARIKVINWTRAPLTNIRAQLHAVDRVSNGYISTRPIRLLQSEPIAIPEFDSASTEYAHTYRFVTRRIATLRHRGSFSDIRFRIVVTHARTGVMTLVEKYYPIDAVIDGTFEVGNSMRVVRQDTPPGRARPPHELPSGQPPSGPGVGR